MGVYSNNFQLFSMFRRGWCLTPLSLNRVKSAFTNDTYWPNCLKFLNFTSHKYAFTLKAKSPAKYFIYLCKYVYFRVVTYVGEKGSKVPKYTHTIKIVPIRPSLHQGGSFHRDKQTNKIGFISIFSIFDVWGLGLA